MRPPRKFQPVAPAALEDRVVLSQLSPTFATLAATEVQTSTPAVPGAPAPGISNGGFPLNIHHTLKEGSPVYFQKTITYSNDPTVQTEDILIVPDNAANTTTISEWINIKDNGGVEKVVDVRTIEALPGAAKPTPRRKIVTDTITTTLPNDTVEKAVDTTVRSGAIATHTNVTTLPDGAVQTTTFTDVFLSRHVQRILDGSMPAPGGGIETFSGVHAHAGHRSITNHRYVEPDGTILHTHSVVTSQDDLGQVETFTTRQAGSKATTETITTTITRFTPPAS